jgi:hypothetical protein
VAIIVAVVMSSVLFVVAAMAVDLGEALTRRQIMQDVADVAALAGAGILPEAAAARQAAVQSLCAQVSDQPERNGWPASTCSDTSWAADGNPDNGEITVFGPDSNGNGFRDDGNPVTLPNGDGRAGSSDDERLAAASSLAGSAIRVQPPPSHVTFHFATAVGIQGVDVGRAATAAMGTPSGLGTPPFYLRGGDLPPTNATNEVCMKLRNRQLVDASPRCNAPSAFRGYLNEPRNEAPTAPATVPQLNVAVGLDHGVAPWTQLPAPPNTPPTPLLPCTSQSGATLAGSGHLAVNCLRVAPNPRRPDIERGFFAADGRMRRTDTCPGNDNTGGSGGDYSGFDGNSLFQDSFLNPNSGATVADLQGYVLGSSGPVPTLLREALSSAVLRCPRLLLLPVLSVPVSGTDGAPDLPPGGAAYPVLSMQYLWLGGTDADNGFVFEQDGDLAAIHGWLLDPALFSPQVAQSTGLDPFAGAGTPRQVRLIHDRDDSQPAMAPPLGPS